jgi:hypothetical protein
MRGDGRADVLPFDAGVSVRPAASRAELEQAFRLVYDSYLARDYVRPNPWGIRLSAFNMLPTTVTFVAVLRGTVIATTTLVCDTPVGLPMDEIYRDEMQRLRGEGRKVSEVTMLADRRRQVHRALALLCVLMKRLFDYATLVARLDDLCITINPRHESYYERYLLFRPLGELRDYPSVCSNPALAKRLDLRSVRAECEGNEGLIQHFFTDRTPVEVLTGGYRLSPEDLRYFLVDVAPVLAETPPELLECLRQCHPGCPWDDWLKASRDRA